MGYSAVKLGLGRHNHRVGCNLNLFKFNMLNFCRRLGLNTGLHSMFQHWVEPGWLRGGHFSRCMTNLPHKPTEKSVTEESATSR